MQVRCPVKDDDDAAMRTIALDDRGSFAWVVGDRLERSSCALSLNSGCVVVDPVDIPELDVALEQLGRVVGVVTLLDRHQRDSAAVAERHGAPRLVPTALGGSGIELDGLEVRTVTARRGWRETLLWLPARRVLVCPETLGTARYFLARRDDSLGVHPFRRLFFPHAAFAGLEPRAIAAGHGPPVTDGAEDALREVLARVKRDAPRAWLRLAPTFFSGS